MLNEEAKAKAYDTTLQVSGKTAGFLAGIFGPALEEYGRAWHEKAKLYRLKNGLAIMDEGVSIMEKRGLTAADMKVISIRYAVPLLEKMLLENDEHVRKMWAGLIANSIDPGKRQNI